MKSKILRFVFAISLLMNLSVLAAVGYHYCRSAGCLGLSPAGRVGRYMERKLGLTAEQKKNIEEKDLKFRKAAAEAREEIIAKRRELMALLSEENPDRNSIDTVLKEISGLQSRIETLAVDHVLEEKAALNSEQRAEYLELLKRRMEGKNRHRGGYR